MPIDVAAITANTLGLKVVEAWNVDSGLASPTGRTNLAGWIDRSRKTIAIARQLPLEVKRFTLAHEIGHLVTQPNVVPIQFREDPRTDDAIRGEQKSAFERQADLFAGFMTVPRKLVVDYYTRMFGSALDGANITENQAYAVLGESGIPSVIAKMSSLELAELVAERVSLVFDQPRALAEIFGVSKTAMGIQLLRVGLVRVSESEIRRPA